jgi:hypothetical protein
VHDIDWRPPRPALKLVFSRKILLSSHTDSPMVPLKTGKMQAFITWELMSQLETPRPYIVIMPTWHPPVRFLHYRAL